MHNTLKTNIRLVLQMPVNIKLFATHFVKVTQGSKYKKETSTQMYTPFLMGFNYNMDHMRISGTEPSSVILSQTKYLKR